MLFYIASAIILLGVAYLHALAADPMPHEEAYHPPYQPSKDQEGFKDAETRAAPPPTRHDIEPEIALSTTGLASASLAHQSTLVKDIRELLRRELREQRNRPVE